MGIPQVSTYPTSARSKFGDRRLGNVRHAADINVGIAGRRGAFAAFALEANLPALLRGGALEALGGQSDFARVVLTIQSHGADIPLYGNVMGRYILAAVASG